jgi:type II secretory pathway component PulF
MTIPTSILGPACLVLGLLLTFVLPIQRGRIRNQLWDLITLALFVAGAWWVNYWDGLSNLGVGVIAGVIAILIRDFRLWKARFRDQVYRRTSPRYWYGRAYGWWGRRRRRRRPY